MKMIEFNSINKPTNELKLKLNEYLKIGVSLLNKSKHFGGDYAILNYVVSKSIKRKTRNRKQ